MNAPSGNAAFSPKNGKEIWRFSKWDDVLSPAIAIRFPETIFSCIAITESGPIVLASKAFFINDGFNLCRIVLNFRVPEKSTTGKTWKMRWVCSLRNPVKERIASMFPKCEHKTNAPSPESKDSISLSISSFWVSNSDKFILPAQPRIFSTIDKANANMWRYTAKCGTFWFRMANTCSK